MTSDQAGKIARAAERVKALALKVEALSAEYASVRRAAAMPMIDFNVFFERVFTCALCDRAFLAWEVAVHDTFAAKVFRAFSATARLRIIALLLGWPGGEDPEEKKPLIEVVKG